jgi:WD40 repeat protein
MNGHQSTSKGTNGHVQGNGHLQLATRPQGSYFGHDREEATRLIIQGLLDLGYESAANRLIQESGFELETPSVAAFRHAVLNGNWEHAEELLFGPAHSPVGGGVHIRDNGLILADHADESEMRFWLRQQKFLELLEAQETGRALAVLRTDLTPLYQSVHKLHFLSSLLMCHSTEDLRVKADWDGAQGSSRRVLLSELSKCLSPSVMIPEHRLAVLMDEVQRSQAYNCLWHSSEEPSSLYVDHTCSKEDFPREVAHTLKEHRGEVWFVAFSNDGSRLASCGGSEDCRVVIWDTDTFDVIHFLDEHNEGVSSVAWSPNDELLVTCSLDRCARVWETEVRQFIVYC